MNPINSLNIRGKLILILMLVAGISSVVTAWMGYQSGKDNLTARIHAQLKSLSEVSADNIELFFDLSEGQLLAMGADPSVAAIMDDMTKAVANANSADPAAARDKLANYYTNTVAPKIYSNSTVAPEVNALLPTTAQGIALQLRYLMNDMTGDTAPYDALHARHSPTLKQHSDTMRFYDLFLIAPDGTIVFTVTKEIDFLTNLRDGPHRESGLARAFRQADANRAIPNVYVEDYSFYGP